MTQLAFVFPGQGSQTVGMLAELAADNRLKRRFAKRLMRWATICGSWFSRGRLKS